MKPLAIFKYQLYLLQLEEYEIKRYFKLLFKKGYFKPSQPLRKNIVWTNKARVIASVVFFFVFFRFAFLIFQSQTMAALFFLVFSFLFLPFLFAAALFLLKPLEFLVKIYFISQAKKRLKQSQAKVIAVAGSYGKTTMKNVLQTALSAKLVAQATPKSINTPLGISQWLLSALKNETDILIIEMGEYYKGDIKKLAKHFPADIVVLTGINEAHLERFKTIQNTIETVFELVKYSKKSAPVILNGDDNNVNNNYQKYTNNRQTYFYSQNIPDAFFNAEKLCWVFNVGGLKNIEVNFLGKYILGNVEAALIIAKLLNIQEQEIKKGILHIKSQEHRLFPIKTKNNILIIDDSYNANSSGVGEAINVLSRFQGRRKIFLTPGLVEAGTATEKVHQEIGGALAGVVDKVILIKNSATPFISQGLQKAGFDKSNIIWFNSQTEAHNALKNTLQPNDVILLQNDWGDRYI